MNDQSGFKFYPSKYSPQLGHQQLDIVLAAAPTERVFDTKNVQFDGLQAQTAGPVLVSVPWSGKSTVQVLAGRLKLVTHREEVLYVFCFGGDLKISNEGDYTKCELISPAPIFDLPDDTRSVQAILVGELEGLFAKQRAELEPDETQFYDRLAKANPHQLFLASLGALEQHMAELPVLSESQKYKQIKKSLHHAVETLQKAGEWSGNPPTWAEVMG